MRKEHLLKATAALSVAFLMLFTFAGPASAVVEPMTLAELISKAETIVRGTVSKIEPHWNEDKTMIYTTVTLTVQSYLKGETTASQVSIEVPGGTVDGLTLWVSDTPKFEEGQEVIVFLRKEYFQVVGWFQGKYTIEDGVVVEKGMPVELFTAQIRAILQGVTPPPEPSATSLAAETCPPTLSDFYAGIKWPGSCPTMDYEIYENTADTVGEGAAIQAAAQTWTNVSNSCFAFSYAGPTTRSAPVYDGHNVLRWGSTGGSIATNYVWYWGSDLLESDVVFEDNYLWSADPAGPPPNRMDVQNIATHELGHALVLVDLYQSCNSQLTMYGYASYGETKKRSLEPGDEDGIRYIYPGELPTPTPTPTPCVIVGDVNDDGVVDIDDVMQTANHWRATAGEPDYDPNYDLDTDGDIDIVDIMIVVANWGSSC